VNAHTNGSARIDSPTPLALLVESRPFLAVFLRSVLGDTGHSAIISSTTASVGSLRRSPTTILFGPGSLGKKPIATIRRVRAACPDARVVAIVSEEDPAWNALAGACGLDAALGPDASPEDLAAALRPSSEDRQENGVLHRTSYAQ
jgi:DNA-binding NarL/FixJ family response regulator